MYFIIPFHKRCVHKAWEEMLQSRDDIFLKDVISFKRYKKVFYGKVSLSGAKDADSTLEIVQRPCQVAFCGASCNNLPLFFVSQRFPIPRSH